MKVDFRDLPDWARQAVKRYMGNSQPSSHVMYTESVSFGSVWHDSCRRYVIARNERGEIKSGASCYGRSLINASPTELAMHQGGTIALRPDQAILELLTYPKTARLYIHPANAPKTIEAPQPELSAIQQAILDCLCGLTSAGRKDTWQRYNVPVRLVNAVCQELADLGFVKIAKNGAVRVTNAGYNQRGNALSDRGTSYFYKWDRECYDWRSRKLTGWAADIIRSYDL